MSAIPFGLDIGATTMKVVWFDRAKEGFLLNACSTYTTPPKGMLSESPIDQQEMMQAIKSIVQEAKITTTSVNIALPENQVYTRVIEMPVLSDKELSTAILWEAEQYIPVPLASITFDYKVLKRPEQAQEGSRMQVLLVGAPTIVIEKYQKIIEWAGLSINSIETEILSVARALTYSPGQDHAAFPPTLIVNIGALSTSLAIVKDGVIVFTYGIPFGGTAISRAIASDFGFTISQAEEYKKVYGVSQELLGGKIGKASEPILMSILGEVKKALGFYSEKYKEAEPIRQILLAGGTAKLPGIDAFFAKNAGVESAIANPWNVLGGQQVPQEILDNASDYTIAIGLAMKDHE